MYSSTQNNTPTPDQVLTLYDGLRTLVKIIVEVYLQGKGQLDTNIITKKNKLTDSPQLNNVEKIVLSLDKVSKLLGLSKGTTYELIRQSQIPSAKFVKRILEPRCKLIELLEKKSMARKNQPSQLMQIC